MKEVREMGVPSGCGWEPELHCTECLEDAKQRSLAKMPAPRPRSLALAPLTFWLDDPVSCGTFLCIVGWSAASLAPLDARNILSCPVDNQKSLQKWPNVP